MHTAVPRDLRRDLRARLGPEAATNHRGHARAARAALIALIEAEASARSTTTARLRLDVALGREAMDRHGRPLAWLSAWQPDGDRPASWNERLLATGAALPYFIWPNFHLAQLPRTRRALRIAGAANGGGVGRSGRCGPAREDAGGGACGAERGSGGVVGGRSPGGRALRVAVVGAAAGA